MNKTEKKVYEDTIKMFGGVCALCGSPEIHMHHIRYGSADRKTYMGNVIPLCHYHHRLVHTNKHMYQPILLNIIERRIEIDARIVKIHDSADTGDQEESSASRSKQDNRKAICDSVKAISGL